MAPRTVSPQLTELRRLRACCAALMLLLSVLSPPPAVAAGGDKPYDDRLLRLSEILGAVHYLRELCGAGDGLMWRKQMQDLMSAEGSSALRRARLSRAFNQGYRSYSRTYNVCTGSAETTIKQFLTEGSQIADDLVKTYP